MILSSMRFPDLSLGPYKRLIDKTFAESRSFVVALNRPVLQHLLQHGFEHPDTLTTCFQCLGADFLRLLPHPGLCSQCKTQTGCRTNRTRTRSERIRPFPEQDPRSELGNKSLKVPGCSKL